MGRPNHYQEKANRQEELLIWEAYAKAKPSTIAEWLGISRQSLHGRKKNGLHLTMQESIILRMHLDELGQQN